MYTWPGQSGRAMQPSSRTLARTRRRREGPALSSREHHSASAGLAGLCQACPCWGLCVSCACSTVVTRTAAAGQK